MDPSEELRQSRPQAQYQPRHWQPNRARAAIERVLPFWEPQLIVAVAIALDLALPGRLTIGPDWLVPSLEGGLLVGLVILSPHPRVRDSRVRRRVAIGLIGCVSLVNIVSLVLLSHYLLEGGKAGGRQLILSGVVLWATNVLVFSLWYWELDRGGPSARAEHEEVTPDFLFPQMTFPGLTGSDWAPGLVDYLYLSFTNATAFSPTDTMPLTPNAKLLMTAQALASLLTIALVVSRAVNVLS